MEFEPEFVSKAGGTGEVVLNVPINQFVNLTMSTAGCKIIKFEIE